MAGARHQSALSEYRARPPCCPKGGKEEQWPLVAESELMPDFLTDPRSDASKARKSPSRERRAYLQTRSTSADKVS